MVSSLRPKHMEVVLYKTVDVWRRLPGSVVLRYRCFQIMNGGGFIVQSADYHYPDGKSEETKVSGVQLDQQFLELLSEMEPCERSTVFPTLEAAIEDFDVGFEIGKY